MIRIVVNEKPISKSNFKIVNKQGRVFMPSKGKDSKYVDYENSVIRACRDAYKGEPVNEPSILVLKLFFNDKRKRDIHNYPKSICDGIEKSGIITNDYLLKPVVIEEYFDKENPRAEIEIYKCSEYDLSYRLKGNSELAFMTKVDGNPISKSNFKLPKADGTSWMPTKGKHSKYDNYEKQIAWQCMISNKGDIIDEPSILVLKLFFKDNRRRDIHNYPKSICDGIEKSGIISNDNIFKPIVIEEKIDAKNPRVEIGIFPQSKFELKYDINKK